MSPLSPFPPVARGARRKRIFGFTLVELLGVVVVIGILAAISLVKYNGQKDKAYQAAMLNDVRNFATIEETNASVSSSYSSPDVLPGFRYTKQVATLGFATEGNTWALLVEHQGSKFVCGVQSRTGQSLRPACAIPSSIAIGASTTTPSAGETVVYDITGYLAQVASAIPAAREGFMVPSLLASSNYSNVALIAWDFGDSTKMSGPPSTASVVTHTYSHAGNYVVRVGIVGASGAVYSAILSGHATGGTPNGNQLPIAAFSVGANPIIDGTSTVFDASASNDPDGSISSYQWSFGDGGTATGATPAHTYTVSGTYSVTLKVTDNQGGVGAIQQAVTVIGTTQQTLAAIFVSSPADSGVAGTAVTFTANQDPAIGTYTWSFGDGSVGSGASTTHTYSAGGNYPVTLTVAGTGVVSDQSTHSLRVAAPAVNVNQAPVAAFTMSPHSVQQGQAVSFDASGSYDSDGSIASYSWDFGDFASASGVTATHSYDAGGAETIALTVTDNQGASTVSSHTVNVIADVPPAAQFTILPTHPVTGRPTTFNGTGSSDADGTIVSYAWAYGDGGTGVNATDTHTYLSGGSRVVVLTVVDNAGVSSTSSQTVTVMAPPMAAFSMSSSTPFTGQSVTLDGSGSSVSGGTISSYAWSIGGGTPAIATGASTQASFAVAGQEIISLLITDSNQNTDSVSHTVMVRQNHPPVANATVSSTSAQAGQTLTFSGSTSSDPDGNIASYAWAFGDGSDGTGVSTTHSYSASGSHTATLTVTDDQGAASSATVTVSVNAPPVSSFTTSALTVPTGASVDFDGSASSDADGSIAGYAWSFGDGNVGTGVTSTHAYTTGGIQTITLTVTDDGGATGASSHTVTVSQNQAPSAQISASAASVTPGTIVTFDGSGSADPDGTVASYSWNFGDSNTSASASPAHAYVAAGHYTVSLTVTDNSGARSGAVTTVIAVNTPPVAAFSVSGSPAANRLVTFTSTSSDPDGQTLTSSYDYGDGSSGSGATHTYTVPGTYTATLTVTDTYGVSNSASHGVVVGGNIAPTANFTSSPASATPGQAVTFDASSSTHDSQGSIASYAWAFGDTQAGTGVRPTHAYATGGHYSVQLTVTDDLGQTATHTASAIVNSPPVAHEVVPDSAYTNGLISVNGSTSTDDQGIASYDWNWGDGSAHGSGSGASHAYSTIGNYTVVLAVSDGDGATSSAAHVITVTAASNPTVSFTVNLPHPTTGQTVGFTSSAASANRGGTISSYAWDFADGATTSITNPTHAFAVGGNYTVTLAVTDNLGATGTASRVVAVNVPPAVSFTATPGTPVSGQTITFTSAASDADGSIAGYAWNFGDGTSAATANTTHAYASSGSYATTLTVTDNLGATSQTSQAFNIVANIPPTATASASSSSVQPNQTVTFTGSASAHSTGATIVSYSWDFGDGSGLASAQNSTHSYSAVGTWTARLTITDSYSQTGIASQAIVVSAPTASRYTGPSTSVVGRGNTFTSPARDSSGNVFTGTDWNFGDGAAHSSSTVATHTYTTAGTKTVTLTLTNGFGNTVIETGSVVVAAGIAPTAAFSSSPTYPVPGATVSFDASASSANNSGGTLMAYAWDFADGGLGTGVTTTYAFSVKGDYAVKLTVTDETGMTASATRTISVDAPVASITGASVSLSGQSQIYTSNSTDAHLTISSFSWSVSGASPTVTSGSSNSVSTKFTTTGTGTVSLTVTNSGGATSTATQTVTVNSAVAPTVSLSLSPTTPEAGQAVTLTATATSNNSGGTITTYHYDYGDGLTKDTTANVVTHAYSAGPWSATVKATDSYGAATSSGTQSITAFTPTAIATMAGGVTSTSTVVARSNSFTATTTLNGTFSAANYTWAWGDGTANTTLNSSPSHAYATAGTYTLALTITDSHGGTAVATRIITVTVNNAPTSTFTTNPSGGTATVGSAVTAVATSTDAEGTNLQYQWYLDGTSQGVFSTTSTYTYSNVTAGAHTLYLITKDADGVTTTSATYNFTAAAQTTLMSELAGYTTGLWAAYDPTDVTLGTTILKDESGNSNNCTLTSTAAAARSAATGVITFGGSDVATCGSMTVAASGFTVIGVYNLGSVGNYNGMADIGNGGTLSMVRYNSSSLSVYQPGSYSSADYGLYSNAYNNVWATSAVSASNATGITVSVNALTASGSGVGINTGSKAVKLGYANANGNPSYMIGKMGVVLIYQGALNQTQISAIRAQLKDYATKKSLAYSTLP